MFNRYKAFLFDLNGTMINDMPYHIKACHNILNGLGACISMEKMKEEFYGKNEEILERIFPGRFTIEEKNRMGLEKEKQYQKDFRQQLQLIKGLDCFLDQSNKAGIKMAVGTAAIMYNVDFVLDGLGIRHYFDVLVSADEVTNSKPDPETWLSCADRLGVSPKECIVFEDVPKGVDAAQQAGMDCVVITTMHGKEEFSGYTNVLSFITDYDKVKL
ncbi:MAG: HAD family hydrolase [Chitinophagaceae bacterium]